MRKKIKNINYNDRNFFHVFDINSWLPGPPNVSFSEAEWFKMNISVLKGILGFFKLPFKPA